ncbi:MAG: chemotaxis protein CheD [Candidatus Lokiarchaeota archaeon]|nr:chemotaxis protein CheD [Candidatus Lokiarchaeota archaeon]
MMVQIRGDRITELDVEGAIYIPIGHYVIINKKIVKNIPLIKIHGLGSCISLILLDNLAKIYAMTHVLLPSSEMSASKEIHFPQKYANIAVKDLVEKLLEEGARVNNLKAIVIGGSKIFRYHQNNIGEQNANVIRKELNKLGIRILKEDIGGSKGRNVIFDVKKVIVFVKTTGQGEFIRLYGKSDINGKEKEN